MHFRNLLSTHVVEEVARTCRNLAVLAKGRILFRGTISGLIEHAHKVWTGGSLGRPHGCLDPALRGLGPLPHGREEAAPKTVRTNNAPKVRF